MELNCTNTIISLALEESVRGEFQRIQLLHKVKGGECRWNNVRKHGVSVFLSPVLHSL